LKAVGDNKSAPFERQLTNLYTKGTYVDDFNLDDEVSTMAPSTGYIMCIVEDPAGGTGTDERVVMGMVVGSAARCVELGCATFDWRHRVRSI
jgi:DNA mismatch repair protein MSH3